MSMRARRKRWGYPQPVNLFVVCETKDELVDHPIDAHSSANEFKCCVIGIVEDEMVEIELAQASSADPSGQLHRVRAVLNGCQFHGHTVGT